MCGFRAVIDCCRRRPQKYVQKALYRQAEGRIDVDAQHPDDLLLIIPDKERSALHWDSGLICTAVVNCILLI